MNFKITKTISCISVALICFLGNINAQTIFYEGFNNIVANNKKAVNLPTGWTLYNDDNKPVYAGNNDLSFIDKAWKVYQEDNGNMLAISPSFFKPEATADRWMITPQIDLTNTSKPCLTFRAASGDEKNKDGFQVLISTESTDKEAFNKTLKTIKAASSKWTNYNIDLSEFVGQKIHIAFVQNSTDKYVIYIDDILFANSIADFASCTEFSLPRYIIKENYEQTTPLKFKISNIGSTPITSYKLICKSGETLLEKEITTNLAVNASETITIDNFTIRTIDFSEVSVLIENINGKADTKSNTAITTTFLAIKDGLPSKSMLLESFSSGTCMSCPGQNDLLHAFILKYKGNEPLAYSNLTSLKYQLPIPRPGDPCITHETLGRGDFYNVMSAPTIYISGKIMNRQVEDQMISLADTLEKFNNTPSPIRLSIDLKKDGANFKVEAKVTSILPNHNDYTLYVCLIEDSINHIPIMNNGESKYYYTVRKMLDNDKGVTFAAPKVGLAYNKSYDYTFTERSPKIFSRLEDVNVVVFVQNNKTREILQSIYSDQTTVSNSKVKKTSLNVNLYPNPLTENSAIYFTPEKTGKFIVSITDVQGRSIFKSFQFGAAGIEHRIDIPYNSLDIGMYVITVETLTGQHSQKIIKQ